MMRNWDPDLCALGWVGKGRDHCSPLRASNEANITFFGGENVDRGLKASPSHLGLSSCGDPFWLGWISPGCPSSPAGATIFQGIEIAGADLDAERCLLQAMLPGTLTFHRLPALD